MSQMPEIKGVVNKEPDRDKKKAGLLTRLFGGGGSGGSGLGGFGGGASGGGLAGGGILATKAGLLALILAGTTVAGGIGMLGYRLFGPGADSSGSGDNLQLFAPKPKEAPNADGQAASKDGSSESLNEFNKANKTAAPADGSAAGSGTLADATAAGAAGSASAGGAATGPINKMGDNSNGTSKAPLKNVAKFGTLSSGSGGGGGAAVANSAVPKTAGGDLTSGSKGTLSSTRRASAATVGGGTARRGFGSNPGAVSQAFGARNGNLSYGSQGSQAGGVGYDGGMTGGSNITGAGTPIGAPGVGSSAGGTAQPTSLNGPNSTNSSTNVPTPLGAPAAPWQSQIQEAQMIIGAATALLLICSLLAKSSAMCATPIIQIIGGVVAALGVMVALIGGTIAHGKYAQGLQGGVLAAAGAGLVLAGVMAATSTSKTTTHPPSDVTDPDTGGVQYANGYQTDGQGGVLSAPGSTLQSGDPNNIPDGAVTTSNSMFGSGGISNLNTFVIIGGGLGLAGLAATMMVPPTKYPAQDANDPNWPKSGLVGYQQFPSEQALKKMVA